MAQLSPQKPPSETRARHESFKNLAAGINSLVTAIGLGIAGLWAVTTFFLSGGPQRSLAELAKLNWDVAKAELEVRAKVNAENESAPTIEIMLEPVDLSDEKSPDRRGLITRVTFENKGGRELKVQIPERPLHVSRVSAQSRELNYLWAEHHQQIPIFSVIDEFEGSAYAIPRRIGDLTLQPGRRRQLSTYCEVPGPGMYFVSFTKPVEGLQVETAGDYVYIK